MRMAVLAISFPGGTEWIIIGFVALLLFGRRLPEVARSVGKSITEFKKGMRDMKDDVDDASEDVRRIAPPKDDPHELPEPSTASNDLHASAQDDPQAGPDGAAKPLSDDRSD